MYNPASIKLYAVISPDGEVECDDQGKPLVYFTHEEASDSKDYWENGEEGWHIEALTPAGW